MYRVIKSKLLTAPLFVLVETKSWIEPVSDPYMYHMCKRAYEILSIQYEDIVPCLTLSLNSSLLSHLQLTRIQNINFDVTSISPFPRTRRSIILPSHNSAFAHIYCYNTVVHKLLKNIHVHCGACVSGAREIQSDP